RDGLACTLYSVGSCSAYMRLYFFFFFQAEDGIRDDLVTGVQTCALPIWRGSTVSASAEGSAKMARATPRSRKRTSPAASSGAPRSEERRVGKEWRWRGSRYE